MPRFLRQPTVLMLYPFRYLDPVSKRRVKARYVAEREDIAARYERWEIIGPSEMRKRGGELHSFIPYAHSPPHDPEDPPKEPVDDPPPWEPTPKEQPPEETTNLHRVERVLVLLSFAAT